MRAVVDHVTTWGRRATDERRGATVTYEQRIHLARTELDGLAGDEEVALLRADEAGWAEALEGLLRLADRDLAHVRATVHGPERRLVLDDFGGERDRIAARLEQLRGTTVEEVDDDPGDTAREDEPRTGTAQLQLSWGEDRLIAWGGGLDAESDDLDTLRGRLAAVGAPAQGWEEHEPVPLPDGTHAPALSTTLSSVLGWLASLQTSAGAPFLGPSVTWMALVTALGVRLAARGRVVPQLSTDRGKGGGGRSDARVSWAAGLVDRTQLRTLSRAMPGVVTVARQQKDPLLVTLAVLDATTDTISRQAAATVEVPAAPRRANSPAQLAEVVLAHLGGQQLNGQTRDVQEMHKALRRWARTVMGEQHVRLIIEMDEPDGDDVWELRTLASVGRGTVLPVEAAMSQANQTRRQRILRELERLERTYPRLRRGRIRGEVVLNQNEAWQLMSVEGRKLLDQGFDVRVPLLQKRKARVGLRVTAVEEHRITDEGEKRSANDLHNVTWSVMLDDVEVDAEEIRRLAAESRPMVQSHGRWVEVDHADLQAAAEALEDREQHRSMTGADMLRYALGLEEAPLGEVSVAGRSWATQLLEAATDVPEDPDTELEGFEGELRSYQAHANAWLDFLDGAGLGGILALDMGLGKTPTVLAHLTTTRHRGPSLAIVPPAVAGNWAREAERFVPDLEVVVHHGQGRAEVDELPRVAEKADLLITTYGTALRDIEGLEQVRWGKVILDEAQVIKNHTSETAQQLRRLDAHGRIALTGTPIENGLSDLWALLDFCNPGLVGDRTAFMSQLGRDRSSGDGGPEEALRTLNGVLVFRRTKAEPAIAAELPERIDELDHCVMTKEQVGLYQAVLDDLVETQAGGDDRKGAVLAAITKLKQICNHPAAFTKDDGELAGRSGKLERLHEILDNVFATGERALIFTHFATWGERLADHLAAHYGRTIDCYHGGLSRKQRDEMVARFQALDEPGAMVLSLKAGGTGLNLTAASHVILYDRWWNPAVEDQARDRVWRIGQTRTVVAHRLVCPGTVDERVEEVVQGKRRIADMVLPRSSSVGDLDSEQLRTALGLDESMLLTEEA